MLLEEAARNTRTKEKRINIRISSRNLTRIQKKAVKRRHPLSDFNIKHITQVYYRKTQGNSLSRISSE